MQLTQAIEDFENTKWLDPADVPCYLDTKKQFHLSIMSQYKKTALVLGAGGFIGSHMVKRLKSEGYWVRGVDLHYPEFSGTHAHEFITGDLRDVDFVKRLSLIHI